MALILIHFVVVVVLSFDDAPPHFILNFGFNNFMSFIVVEAFILVGGFDLAVRSQEECRNITVRDSGIYEPAPRALRHPNFVATTSHDGLWRGKGGFSFC